MKIDLGLVAEALDSGGDIVWYLDKTTGEVFAMHDDIDDEDDDSDLIEDEPNRFLAIDELDPREGILIMEDYVATLPDGEAKRGLQRAVNGPKPFAAFKQVLHEFADERKAWFELKNERMLQHAREFLARNEIEFE